MPSAQTQGPIQPSIKYAFHGVAQNFVALSAVDPHAVMRAIVGRRVIGGGVGGVAAGPDSTHIPGSYAALLAHERDRWDDPRYWDPRWMRMHHTGRIAVARASYVSMNRRRRSALLDELEAGTSFKVGGGARTRDQRIMSPTRR